MTHRCSIFTRIGVLGNSRSIQNKIGCHRIGGTMEDKKIEGEKIKRHDSVLSQIYKEVEDGEMRKQRQGREGGR